MRKVLAFGAAASMFASAAICSLVTPVSAATISVSNDPICRLTLEGEIEFGDVARFTELAEFIFPAHVTESTAENTVCLNSPGGSYVEGVLLAELFYEKGIGTVIGPQHACYSACALAFMMGMAQGPEVSFINRSLHIGGELGFHRPYLQLPADAAAAIAEVEAAYDGAITSVVAYLALANKSAPWSSEPLVAADLIERIFSYSGQNFFMIDSVEKAVRWDIAIEGVEIRIEPNFQAAYYACENTLQWEVGVHSDPPNYLQQHLGGSLLGEPWVEYEGETADGYSRFSVNSRKSGYASASCIVELNARGVRVCGADEYTGLVVGGAQCPGDFRWANSLAVFPPQTQLDELAGFEYAEVMRARCTVFTNSTLTDDEPCLASYRVVRTSAGEIERQRFFAWPSGSTTVVSQTEREIKINDYIASTGWRDNFDGCVTSSLTGNEFCFSMED